MKKIAVLGSTGSIGTQTLDVVSRRPEEYEVVGLAAGNNIPLLLEQVRQFRPKWVSAGNAELASRVRAEVPADISVVHGEEGLKQIAGESGANYVVCALVGSLGLTSTLAAIEAGANIGLANKETLVTAGHLVMRRAKEKGVSILPVDSEHSAIFQCLNGESAKTIKRIMLTASGGSFRHLGREQLRNVTVEDALKHPNWSMGAKITIDSATMANKGLEVIEAHWLFDLAYEQIDVILHPESIVHSMVEFVDTSVMAQLGNPDMRVPIQYALTYPERTASPASALDLLQHGSLNFKPMSFERYPCLRLAYEAGRMGGTATTVYNAANEVAVARFLKGDIPFLAIEETIERVLGKHQRVAAPSLEAILETDAWARMEAEAFR
ncbi:1-deoxy-D-xylulose-5-phosphate reductoisomerase [Cohnella boryungensis]|uniref:1-deoxy-D-xylulose 5-phosphate reductoisomerase n=1 Tax=Cohnella boryungensis TaxID=768479 RepID=A0ABV8SJ61_9BACL